MALNQKILELSEDLAISSIKHVEHYFPIDRFFIEKYGFLDQIKEVNSLDFILCNFERINNTYTIQLFLCLPELWEDISYEDLLFLIENFTNSFSFYALINFSYKYLEIDLLNEILDNRNVNEKYKIDCLDYLTKTITNLYLDEEDIFEFESNLFGIKFEDWTYAKEKLYIDNRIKRALPIGELSRRLTEFQRNL